MNNWLNEVNLWRKNLKMFQQFGLAMVLGGLLLLTLTGCDNSVKTVKNGCPPNRNDITNEALMNVNFSSGEWGAITENGRKIVYFHGKIRPETHLTVVKAIEAGTNYADLLKKYEGDQFQSKIDAKIKQIGDGQYQQQMQALNDHAQVLQKEILKLRKSDSDDSIAQVEKKGKQLVQMNEEYNQLAQKYAQAELKASALLFDDVFWPTNSEVEFRWVVFPDGKHFEFDSLANESWNKWGLMAEQIFNLMNLPR